MPRTAPVPAESIRAHPRSPRTASSRTPSRHRAIRRCHPHGRRARAPCPWWDLPSMPIASSCPGYHRLSGCPRSAPTLEELHGALVLLRRRAAVEGSQIASLAGLGILLPGVEPVLPGGELTNHLRLRSGFGGDAETALPSARSGPSASRLR